MQPGKIVLVLLGVVFVGCAQEKRDATSANQNQIWVNTAPTTQEQAGYIVRTADQSEVEALLIEKGARARQLHHGEGIYEIFDVSREDLEHAFPSSEIEKNIVFTNLIPRKRGDIRKYMFDLKDCVPGLDKPKPKITVNKYQSIIVSGNKILSGDVEVDFSYELSTDFDGKKDGLNYMWVVYGPHASVWEEKALDSQKLSFKPDMPGGYQIYLVIKNKLSSCSYASEMFGVTLNHAYTGPTVKPRPYTEQDRGFFRHLGVINAEKAWEKSVGKDAVIAVIDTGVNQLHPDLNSNIWMNPADPIDGKDNDGNGYIDDFAGWDFIMGDSMPTDDDSHGTHVAGLAASGVSGVAPQARIMSIKALSALGTGDTASITAAIMYAADRGAHIINASFGAESAGLMAALKKSMDYAESKGVLFVAAAGNGDRQTGLGVDNDVRPHYPSSQSNSNVLSVAATNLQGTLSSFSNYGKVSVDLAAPGGDRSDGPLNATFYVHSKKSYVGMAGTSMATPVVAGAAAVLKSYAPQLTALQIKDLLMSSSKKIPALKGKLVSDGWLDVQAALEAVKK